MYRDTSQEGFKNFFNFAPKESYLYQNRRVWPIRQAGADVENPGRLGVRGFFAFIKNINKKLLAIRQKERQFAPA